MLSSTQRVSRDYSALQAGESRIRRSGSLLSDQDLDLLWLHEAGAIPLDERQAQEAILEACVASSEITDLRRPDDRPDVSVIMSTYRDASVILNALKSIPRAAGKLDWEVIVVDASSPTDERTACLDWAQEHNSLCYIRTPGRIGIYSAWNLAITMSRGKFITPLSANDLVLSDAYPTMLEQFDKHPNLGLVFGDTLISESPISHERDFMPHPTEASTFTWSECNLEKLTSQCMVGPHPMWRAELHKTLGYYDDRLPALADQDFALRVAFASEVKHVPTPTGIYTWSDVATSAAGQDRDDERLLLDMRYQWRYAQRYGVSPVPHRDELVGQAMRAALTARRAKDTAQEITLLLYAIAMDPYEPRAFTRLEALQSHSERILPFLIESARIREEEA